MLMDQTPFITETYRVNHDRRFGLLINYNTIHCIQLLLKLK